MITLVDINPEMLTVGQKRAVERGIPAETLTFTLDNAETLENIPSESVDCYTIAFGIRNVTHISAALKAAHRVLKPGGRFSCLEFSQVSVPGLKQIYDFYSFNVIPTIGEVVANDRASYQYLVESIRKFPPQEEFRDMIKEAGFKVIGRGYEDLTGGIAAIHTGWKL